MNTRKSFNPDLLLGAFASALACNRLTPFQVKWILETEGFYEPGKVRIEELAEPLLRDMLIAYPMLAEALVRRQAELLSRPQAKKLYDALQGVQEGLKAPQIQRQLGGLARKLPAEVLYRAWLAIQKTYESQHGQRVLWQKLLEGKGNITSPLDPEIARELADLYAYEQLAKLEHPKAVSSLENARKRLIQSIRKPSHRPSSGKAGERFRTAAVAAASFQRKAGASRHDSWKWVADGLNRADVWRPKGASFTDKTIENWSSKGTYNQHLYEGMTSLANASLFRARTRAQVAEIALFVAEHFGKEATKNS